jgi:hypothetical protein
MKIHSHFVWTREAVVVGKCGRDAVVEYGRHEVSASLKLLNWRSP